MNTPYFNNFMPQPGQFGMPQMPAPTQQMNQIQFVNGIESAKAFTLGPNQSVILMDSNKPVFYQKQADASGFCTIKAYSFQEVKEDQPEDKVALTWVTSAAGTLINASETVSRIV